MAFLCQVRFVKQQVTLKRVRRNHAVVHDRQSEFPIEKITDNSVYFRNEDRFDTRDNLLFNDEYFGDQWYLVRKFVINYDFTYIIFI